MKRLKRKKIYVESETILTAVIDGDGGNYQPQQAFDEKKQKSGDAETLEPARKFWRVFCFFGFRRH